MRTVHEFDCDMNVSLTVRFKQKRKPTKKEVFEKLKKQLKTKHFDMWHDKHEFIG